MLNEDIWRPRRRDNTAMAPKSLRGERLLAGNVRLVPLRDGGQLGADPESSARRPDQTRPSHRRGRGWLPMVSIDGGKDRLGKSRAHLEPRNHVNSDFLVFGRVGQMSSCPGNSRHSCDCDMPAESDIIQARCACRGRTRSRAGSDRALRTIATFRSSQLSDPQIIDFTDLSRRTPGALDK